MKPEDMSIEELEAHLASAYDERGEDQWLADEVRRMSEQDRRATEKSFRRWISEVRAGSDDRSRSV